MSEVPRRGNPAWRPELSPCCQETTRMDGMGCASVKIFYEVCVKCGKPVNRYRALKEDMARLCGEHEPRTEKGDE